MADSALGSDSVAMALCATPPSGSRIAAIGLGPTPPSGSDRLGVAAVGPAICYNGSMPDFNAAKLIPDSPNITQNPAILELRLVDGKSGAIIREFLFAITPQSLTLNRIPLSSVYYTSGGANTGGINAVADVYGMSTPVWSLQGTPGAQPHTAISSTTGAQITTEGQQALSELRDFMMEYQTRVADARAARLPIPLIYLNDGINGETWEVVPSQAFNLSWTTSAPFWGNYVVGFTGITDLSKPRPVADTTFNDAFALSPASALVSSYNTVGKNYVPSDYINSYLQNNPTSNSKQAINAYLTGQNLPPIGG